MSAAAGSAPERGRWRAWWEAVLIYRQPKVFAMLLLGFSAGLPFMLVFQTMSAWLRQAGIERATIGMLAWVGIAYSIKFLWAPVVDRLQLPILHRLLGRRRSWMLLAQLGIAFGLANLAQSDPAAGVQMIAVWALWVAVFSATQDIALDAWRIESAPPELQGGMAAAYQLGYRVAIMTGTAGALWIASDVSWTAAYLTMAVLMSIGLITTLCIAEPKTNVAVQTKVAPESSPLELRVPWHVTARVEVVSAVWGPIKNFFSRYGMGLGLLLFAFIGSYRLTDYAMGVMTNPFYLDHGYTLKQVASVVKAFGLVSAIVGVLIGGTIVARYGVVRSLFVGSGMVMLSNLGFAALASSNVPSVIALACVNSFDNIALGVHGVSLLAFMSTLTSSRYTATQYAVLSSLYAMPGKVLMGTSGFVVDAIGYSMFFVYTACLSIPAMLLLLWLTKKAPTVIAPVKTS